MDLEDWFTSLWFDYAALAPRVSGIRQLLEERGERVVDDHVAFRTLNIGPIDLEALGAQIEALGYRRFDEYHFEAKKLRAWSYVHGDEEGWPRIFVSELLVEKLPTEAQQVLRRLVDEIPDDFELGPRTFLCGRPWAAPTFAEYEMLQTHSEYAAWVAALGLRPNHFTVAVNELDSFRSLEALLNWVEAGDFELNTSGGRIKGSEDELLEQGSTMADQLKVEFADGTHTIPSCYYEFALRYPNPDGTLYDGFVAKSADRIFESTDTKNTEST